MFLLCVYEIIITGLAYKYKDDDNYWKFLRSLNPQLWFYISSGIILFFSVGFVLPVFMLLFTHTINFLTYKTTHERFSSRKNDEDNMEGSMKSDKSSFFGSVLRSEILIRDDAEINDFTPLEHKRTTSNDSIIKSVNNEGVVEGNYIAQMQYVNNKRSKRKG